MVMCVQLNVRNITYDVRDRWKRKRTCQAEAEDVDVIASP